MHDLMHGIGPPPGSPIFHQQLAKARGRWRKNCFRIFTTEGKMTTLPAQGDFGSVNNPLQPPLLAGGNVSFTPLDQHIVQK
jgi:hypothetical protein